MLDFDHEDADAILELADFAYKFFDPNHFCVVDKGLTVHTHAKRDDFRDDFVEDREFFAPLPGATANQARYTAKLALRKLNEYIDSAEGREYFGRIIMERCKEDRAVLQLALSEGHRQLAKIKRREGEAREFYGVSDAD